MRLHPNEVRTPFSLLLSALQTNPSVLRKKAGLKTIAIATSFAFLPSPSMQTLGSSEESPQTKTHVFIKPVYYIYLSTN